MNFVHFTFIENCILLNFIVGEYRCSFFIHLNTTFCDFIFRILNHKGAAFCTYTRYHYHLNK